LEPLWVMGLMSGTSCDGIDGSLIKTDGHKIYEFGPNIYFAYPEDFQREIQKYLGCSTPSAEIDQLEHTLTEFHGNVVKEMQQKFPHKIDLIGFHGQTVFHAPPKTWQIGGGERLAQLTQTDVVYNFRQHDVLQGGQGAPLVPIYHHVLTQNLLKPCAVINIGGVSNVTWMGHEPTPDALIAFDLGPGMALINDWTQRHFHKSFDEDGLLAQQGNVHQSLIEKWLDHPYFSKAYPKSLDRNQFSHHLADLESIKPEDGLATLTAFTARAIYRGLEQLPEFPTTLLLAGGGRRNMTLFEMIAALMPAATQVARIDILGFDGDYIESQAFAYLAARTKNNLPITFPLTTGAPTALCGGQIVRYHGEQCG
jgi:anhydro-N-acetylmuramic acid kinase